MANRALLVGINAYREAPLRGCVNDVLDVRDLLNTKCQFAPADILMITDTEATTATIKKQLENWLLLNAAPGDRLLFHFSGHGTQLPGHDGAVHDVICPVDFDFTEARALSDVDFSRIFSKLPAAVEFNWISDSCHSGGLARALRNSHAVPRYLPPPPAIMAQINVLRAQRAATRSLDGAVERLTGVLIAGCQSQETSADAIFGTRFNGALTYYLIQELRRDQGLLRELDTVVNNVSHALAENGYDQHPQIRGLPDLARKPFLALMVTTAPRQVVPAVPLREPDTTSANPAMDAPHWRSPREPETQDGQLAGRADAPAFHRGILILMLAGALLICVALFVFHAALNDALLALTRMVAEILTRS